ncbi:sensor histidine kinase [Christiangramia fulva]|uniref:histidine kinase n=1 Tax=Christiangramia fulva TaxID=2126553 RepID=A0A2R3Z4A6_9FLAO|nr:HAMP domain-containing sensor histidine kinase [Christiangramia fulva]AVR45074.1 sensor histidine kinase [Christiangramia fulva]
MSKKTKISLLQKTSRAFILISFLLYIISIPALYFYVSKLMETEVEEELYSRSFRLEHYVKKNNELLELPPVFQVVEIPELRQEIIKDTLIYDPSQDEMELFHELSTFKKINGKNYKIIVRSMVVETQDIILVILAYFLISLLIVFLAQFYFSRAWNRILWKSFFHNLSEMKAFSVKNKSPVSLQESNIKEFSELRDEIYNLTEKVLSDYENLKQFTENVSHELQTSLAIMQAKLENFLNEAEITNSQFLQLSSLQSDIQRLAKLNKKLVFLTSLENLAVDGTENVSVNKVVKGLIEDFKELTSAKLEFVEEEKVILNTDPELIRVLIQNLISNAIKYTNGEGEIRLLLKQYSLSVSNPGIKEIEQKDQIFKRFFKSEISKGKGIGLGLAIVKKICELFDYDLTYKFTNQRHHFTVNF